MSTLPLPALLATLLPWLRRATAAAAQKVATTPATPPTFTWLARCGTLLTLQPLRPQHATLLGDFFDGLSTAARRQRFHAAVRGPSPERLAWLANPDFVGRGGFIITRQVCTTVHAVSQSIEVLAEGMWVRSSTPGVAEFALCVAEAWQRQGLGKRLLRSLADSARSQGLQQLRGDVLPGNPAMLALAGSLQFGWGRHPDEPGLLRVAQALPMLRATPPRSATPGAGAGWPRPAASHGHTRWLAVDWLEADWLDADGFNTAGEA